MWPIVSTTRFPSSRSQPASVPRRSRSGPRPELTAVDRGERLFSSARLSHDGWMSCQSCHTDGHTNSLLSDTLGDGSYGAPKRVPSLLGVAVDGSVDLDRLNGPARRPDPQINRDDHARNQTDRTTSQRSDGLSGHAGGPVPRANNAGFDRRSGRRAGATVFEARKCVSCHRPPEYTSSERYDVGLSDEVGNREFNPPSLRAVSRRETLLHDGRARSLEELLQKERHPRGLDLSGREIDDLAAFLRTL